MMKKSGVEQLREEKYRFTIETQGLLYPKHHHLGAKDEETTWSEDDSDPAFVAERKSSPMAQRVATELARVLQEGGSKGFNDDALERLLAGSLQSSSDVSVAKDYIKQVLDQLYGQNITTTSKPELPGVDGISVVQTSRNASPAPGRGLAAMDASSSSSADAPGLGPSLQKPKATLPRAHAAGSGLMAPPWTAAIIRGSGAGTGCTQVTAAQGASSDELERPRPRPHHGRIKEQLDLLQNADQLAAIISVATTAATTAAAAAVKQTMQTPPPLPPGAYARMHAAGQSMVGVLMATESLGGYIQIAQRQQLGSAPILQAAIDAFDDQSPDPLPQQRQGALVSPHRRSIPLVMAWRQEAGPRAAGMPHALDSSRGEHEGRGRPVSRPGPVTSSAEAQLRKHRLRWSQLRAVPLGLSPHGPAGDGLGVANTGELASTGTAGTGSSNLHVVHLGTPRVTSRTPIPARFGNPTEARFHAQEQTHADQDATKGAELGFDHAEGRTNPSGEGAEAVVSSGRDAVESHHGIKPPRAGSNLADENQVSASYGHARIAPVPQRPASAHAGQPDLSDATFMSYDQNVNRTHQHQHRQARDVPAAQVESDGFFVTGGESVFARANLPSALPSRQADAGEVVTKASGVGPRRPCRSALPEDVQEAFHATLAFISDPDGARARQHQAPSWAVMADIEDRKQAQREAEELLGGAFDYTAVKRELERARRTSRLLQDVAGPIGPLAGVGSTASAGAGLQAAGGVRPRAVQGTAAATGFPASVALQPRGDFAGLLPPPHSVWDVDDAWFDLDEFTKAIEAEVAYRAASAATATGPSRRGSPGPKQTGLTATALAITPVSGQTTNAARAGARPSTRRVTPAPDTAELAAGTVRAKQANITESRKRSVSPGRATSPPLGTAAASDASPSPPRAVSKAQASGPVRIAFGRRVDEPPKATEVGTSRARLHSPQKRKLSPGRARSRTRDTGGTSTLPSAAALISPSSTGDVVGQVLSALASVLLSDDEEAEIGDDDDVADPMGNTVAAAGGTRGLVAALADTVPHRDNREAAAQAGRTGSPASSRYAGEPESFRRPREPMSLRSAAAVAGVTVPLALPPESALLPQQLVEAGSELDGHPREQKAAHDNGSKNVRDDTTGQMQAGNGVLGASDSSDAPTTTASLRREAGTPPFLDTSALTSRPQFQLVIDTAHPPITRLPAWAASATAAEGAPAAYAAAFGTAPTGLGFSPVTRQQPAPPMAPSMAFRPVRPQTGNVPDVQHEALLEPYPPQQGGGAGNIIPETSASYGHFRQRQATELHRPQPTSSLPAFPAPGDLPGSTHILPPDAASAAMAAAPANSASAKGPGRHTIDPDQQWEEAVFQAVEDEVVGRLAAVQLAATSQEPRVDPQDLAGMLPPLVDADLSRRLVCDVLRDDLRSLMEKQQQQGSSADLGTIGAPTLEEVVAALAAMPVLTQPWEQEPTSQPETVGQAAADIAENEPTSFFTEGIIPVPVVGTPLEESPSEVQDAGVAGNDYNEKLVVSERSNGMAQPDATGLAVSAVAHAEDGGLGASPSPPVLQTWQPGYAGWSAHQLTQPVQATPVQVQVTPPGTLKGDAMQAFSTRVDVSTAHAMSNPTIMPQKEQGTSTLPDLPVMSLGSADQSSPRKSQAIQAHGVQGRGVQAHGAEARGVQAFGVVEARAVQAHGIEARGTQAAGVQERATQAAGVMNRSSQADPPLPHYLLQVALAAGLSYGAGLPLPQQGVASNGMWAGNAILAPDGAPLSIQRPFFLIPADNSQLSFPLGLYGAASEIPVARGEVNRPPLKLPGLSKLRDSSDVDSSMDSMGGNIQPSVSMSSSSTVKSVTRGMLTSSVHADMLGGASFQDPASEGSEKEPQQGSENVTSEIAAEQFIASDNSGSGSLPRGNTGQAIDLDAGTVTVAGASGLADSETGLHSESDPPSPAPELRESLNGTRSLTYIPQPSVSMSSSSTVKSVTRGMLTSSVADKPGGASFQGPASEGSEMEPQQGSENVTSEIAVGQFIDNSSSTGSAGSTSLSQLAASGPPKAASVLPPAMPMTGGGVPPPPGSPSKPPSLENYQGPTRQLWRPPSAQDMKDPLLSSSETLMASSEASGPTLDPLSRTLLNAQRHGGKLTRAQAAGLADSIDSSVEVSTSVDSAPANFAQQTPTIPGAMVPRQLARISHPRASATLSPGALGGKFQTGSGSELESDEEGPVIGDEESMEAAGLGGAFPAERVNACRDGAVFRLRQYGARRRKLMQQIGIKDPLLNANASTVSTDSSTIGDSIGDEGSTLLRRLSAATRRL